MSSAAWAPSAIFEVTEAAAGAFAAMVLVGVGVYVFVSFALMSRHVGTRQLGVSLRALLGELWVAGVTQPLLPLFYLVGRRMDRLFVRRGPEDARTTPRIPIVFVHGYMQNRIGFIGLARALARRGLGPMFGFNYPWFTSIDANARRLDRFIARICKETGSAVVDVVCHSMGGLVAVEMMRKQAERDERRVRRCVTIATPHAGVLWRGPLIGFGATDLRRGSKWLVTQAGQKLAVPCLSIYSTHDNIVHPKETSSLVLRGGRDVEVEGPAHLAILFSPKVAEHVASFLADPDPV
jgi:pimeloyl-ACP methyl ester carboxylesterase